MEYSSNADAIRHVQLTPTLPTGLPEQEQEGRRGRGGQKCYYDTFAFRDRITNHRFQYREARDNQYVRANFLDWTSTDSPASRQLKNSLNVYKFTKSFQIDCIRQKYLRQSHKLKQNQKESSQGSTENSGDHRLSREALFQINKNEMRRVLETNQRVNSDILRLNSGTHCPPRRRQQKSNRKGGLMKWRILQNEKSHNLEFIQGQAQRRITDKIMNHMKNQIRNNCQYLLNMPIHMQKKALFMTQLRKHRQMRRENAPRHCHTQMRRVNAPRHCHTEIQNCRFTALSNQEDKPEAEVERGLDEKRVMELVKQGFINEVYLQLKNNSHLWESKDEGGNNILHVAAKQGNAEMATILLKVIPSRNCFSLLADTNHLKRTPKQKAFMLGNSEVVNIFDQFTEQNRSMI